MERPRRLTAAFVEKVDVPGRYSDGRGGHGLTLLVRPRKTGGLAKNWAQHLRVDGRLRSFGLGTYPHVRLVEARQKAAQQAAALHAGRSRTTAFDRLMAERQGRGLAAGAPPFAVVAEEALEHDSAKWKGTATADQRQGLIKNYLAPTLGEVEIDRITSDMLMDTFRPIWHTKAPTAKKAWQTLAATFNYALGKNYVETSPLDRAEKGLGRQNHDVDHRESIPWKQVPEVWRAIRDAKASSVTRTIMLIMLTGLRSGEVRGMRWGELDMETATWTIPAERMKGGKEHRVPLTATAMSILTEVAPDAEALDDMALVFPNGGGRELTRTMALRFFQRRYAGYTLHGFRTSLEVWAAEMTDWPSEIVNHQLAHLEGSETIRAYRRTDYFEKRRLLMEAWDAFVTEERRNTE